MKKFFGFARRKSTSSLKGINPRRFSIGSSTSSTIQIQVVRGGYNVDLGKVDSSFSKLHKAALLNDKEKVNKQLKNYDVNCRDSSGRTALHLAIVNANLDIIRTLLEAGANINSQDGDGKTPLMKAVECNHEDLVQFLLASNSDPQISDFEQGNTALHLALSSGSIRSAQFILRNQNVKMLDINKMNNRNETCLHLAVKLPQLNALLEELITKGVSLDAKDDRGKTALSIAKSNDNSVAVNILIKHGAKLDSYDENSENKRDHVAYENVSPSRKQPEQDAWPDTDDEEDSNYDKPRRDREVTQVVKEREKESNSTSPNSVANKPRKESFKRVSSLVDETIIEEYKVEVDNEADEESYNKPSTSHDKRNEDKQIIKAPTQISKFDWNDTSEEESLRENVKVKITPEYSVVKKSNISPDSTEEDKDDFTFQPPEVKRKYSLDGDPIHELEALLKEQPSHATNVDFIDNLQFLLEEPPPKVISPPLPPPPPPPPVEIKPVEVKPQEVRRKSYAEIVSQQAPQAFNQELMQQLKSKIAGRAKSDEQEPFSSPKKGAHKNSKSPKRNRRSNKRKENKIQEPNKLKQLAPVVAPSQTHPIISSNKLSKIPLPLTLTPEKKIVNAKINIEEKRDSIITNTNKASSDISSSEATNDEKDSVSSPPISISQDNYMMTKRNSKNGQTSELENTIKQLRIALEKEKNEKNLLNLEHDKVKEALNQLKKRSHEDNLEKLEKEKSLTQLNQLLNERNLALEEKIRELKSTKSELEEMQRRNEMIELSNKDLLQRMDSLRRENRVIREEQKLVTTTTPSSQVPLIENQNEIVLEFKSTMEQLIADNRQLKLECDKCLKLMLEKSLSFSQENKEVYMKNIELEAELNKTKLELQVSNIRPNRSNDHNNSNQLELISNIKELNSVIVKLEERISRSEDNQQNKMKGFNEEILESVRNLLDQIRAELTNFKDKLTNVDKDKSQEKYSMSEQNLPDFEKKFLEMRNALERLEDQIQAQEMQLFHQSDIISFAPLRKSSSTKDLFISSTNNKNKSSFVQTLFRIQTQMKSSNHNESTLSAFIQQKTHLQKQIHHLKSELGLLSESIHVKS